MIVFLLEELLLSLLLVGLFQRLFFNQIIPSASQLIFQHGDHFVLLWLFDAGIEVVFECAAGWQLLFCVLFDVADVILLDVADVDLTGFVFADEVDELLLNRVHAMHARMLDLLFVDLREIGAQQPQRNIGIAAGLTHLLLPNVLYLLQSLLKHLHVAALLPLRVLLAQDAAAPCFLFQNIESNLFSLILFVLEDAAIFSFCGVLSVLDQAFKLLIEEGVVGVVLF